jgi:hypothetical protein
MTTPLTRTALIGAIKKLPTGAAVTEGFEHKLRASGVLNDGRAERTQKEHWLGWLGEYNSSGAYNRQRWEENARAEQIYNRAVNPAMVLWLGEAAGVPEVTVKSAANAALKAPASLMSKAGAIRRVVPWALVEERLKTLSTLPK